MDATIYVRDSVGDGPPPVLFAGDPSCDLNISAQGMDSTASYTVKLADATGATCYAYGSMTEDVWVTLDLSGPDLALAVAGRQLDLPGLLTAVDDATGAVMFSVRVLIRQNGGGLSCS